MTAQTAHDALNEAPGSIVKETTAAFYSKNYVIEVPGKCQGCCGRHAQLPPITAVSGDDAPQGSQFAGGDHEVLVIQGDFAWPDYEMVVVDSPELQHELRNDGWTIVEASAEVILELLKSKGA